MTKRSKLEIMKDILQIIKDNRNSIKITPLLRKSNLSSSSFKDYYSELVEKGFVNESIDGVNKITSLTEKGVRFLEKYRTIVSFIEEFEL